MTNRAYISELLDRYWEGETTVAEERALKAYFASGEIHPEHRPLSPIFTALREEGSLAYDKPVMVAIPTMQVRRTHLMLYGVAASIALLLAAGVWVYTSSDQPLLLAQNIENADIQKVQPMAAPEILVKGHNDVVSVPVESSKKDQRVSRKTRTAKLRPAQQPVMDAETEKAFQEVKAALALLSNKLNKGKKEALESTRQLNNIDKHIKKKSDS